MTAPITVVILAAGRGTRFKGYGVPKPFVSFRLPTQEDGKQMWQQSVDSLTISHRLAPIFCRDDIPFMTPRFVNTWPLWIERTDGQAISLLDGLASLLDSNRHVSSDLLVVNCDAGYAPGVLDHLVVTGRQSGRIGAVTFEATESEQDRWSYVDDHPQFRNCAEKRFLSPNALAGAYYFPDAQALYLATAVTVREMYGTGWEPYVSHVINHYSGWKNSCRIRREDWYDWGTKEAFERSIAE